MEEELEEYSIKFKDIENYLGIYQITDNGKVYNKKFEKFLKPSINEDGYLTIILHKDGIGKKYYVHRLIAKTFIENSENKNCVDHINGIKIDNRTENLRWVTNSENSMNTKMHKNKKLQVKGINKNFNSFQAQIMKNGKNYNKTFKKLEDAINWRKQKEIELFGEYSYKSV